MSEYISDKDLEELKLCIVDPEKMSLEEKREFLLLVGHPIKRTNNMYLDILLSQGDVK